MLRLVRNRKSDSDQMSDLRESILAIVKSKPGLRARDIAEALGVDRDIVRAVLNGPLKGEVQQGRTYRWYPVEGTEATTHAKAQGRSDTLLSRLSRYYLECISHDDLGGVSEFAESRSSLPTYVELERLPKFDDHGRDAFGSEGAQRLLASVRRDRNLQALFLGYPVRLNHMRSRNGGEGFKVEPLFLFPFQEADNQSETPVLGNDPPQMNLQAFRALTNAAYTSFMEEAIQRSEAVGLGNAADDQPEIDELLARLKEIRPEWDWQEDITPGALSKGAPLRQLKRQGIFNRAVVVAAERSPYTKGLESELGLLQSIEESKYRDTALGAWIHGDAIESPTPGERLLLEVTPLNSEQRQAVQQALSNRLTVITGPPGTGKSQVVTSILINAAWQGNSVLFASKNNKAVDVVETRMNALGSRPALLRLGANQYQNRLAEYLVTLLSATAAPQDREKYVEYQDILASLREKSEDLDAEVQALLDLRNDVDRLEQHVEGVRAEVGEEVFRRAADIDLLKLEHATKRLQVAVNHANREKQHLLARIAWPLLSKARLAELQGAAESSRKLCGDLGLQMPEAKPDATSITLWTEFVGHFERRASQVLAAQEYFVKLRALTEVRSLEELSKQQRELTDALATNSKELWETWLRLQPSRLDQQHRKVLGDYGALIQMIVSANERNQKLGRDVFRRYYKLFPRIVSILSCWAITSLSVRGRVPFEPKFFDLLVIDEASQCDIASVLPLLYRAKRVVVIGDPMQLRHISTLSKGQDRQLLNKHRLLDDFPGWAYSTRSVFDLASSLCRSEDIVALREHHRSHSDIIEFSNAEFYEGRLRVATRYDQLRRPNNQRSALRWVEVTGKAVRPSGGGALNEQEARAVVAELERLVIEGYRGSIGVVSPFRAQANRIRQLVMQRDALASRLAEMDFLADAVHSFQGDERDVILFSPTVSSDTPQGALWFLREYPNLFNVAITRARSALIVVGDRGAALNCDVDYLARFAVYSEKIENRKSQSTAPSNADFGPDYPRVAHPERVSDWERVFYRALYRAGIKSVPQFSVDKYVLDFAVLDGERRLNIEIDGEQYHRNWDGELCRRDQIRNQRMMELGWDVMRFWVYQVRDDLDRSVERVRHWLAQSDRRAKGTGT